MSSEIRYIISLSEIGFLEVSKQFTQSFMFFQEHLDLLYSDTASFSKSDDSRRCK